MFNHTVMNSYVDVSLSAKDSIQVVWSVSKEFLSWVRGFKVRYQAVGSTVIQYSQMLDATTYSHEITRLHENTAYDICVHVFVSDNQPRQPVPISGHRDADGSSTSGGMSIGCVTGATGINALRVAVGSTLGAFIALGIVVGFVMLAKCQAGRNIGAASRRVRRRPTAGRLQRGSSTTGSGGRCRLVSTESDEVSLNDDDDDGGGGEGEDFDKGGIGDFSLDDDEVVMLPDDFPAKMVSTAGRPCGVVDGKCFAEAATSGDRSRQDPLSSPVKLLVALGDSDTLALIADGAVSSGDAPHNVKIVMRLPNYSVTASGDFSLMSPSPSVGDRRLSGESDTARVNVIADGRVTPSCASSDFQTQIPSSLPPLSASVPWLPPSLRVELATDDVAYGSAVDGVKPAVHDSCALGCIDNANIKIQRPYSSPPAGPECRQSSLGPVFAEPDIGVSPCGVDFWYRGRAAVSSPPSPVQQVPARPVPVDFGRSFSTGNSLRAYDPFGNTGPCTQQRQHVSSFSPPVSTVGIQRSDSSRRLCRQLYADTARTAAHRGDVGVAVIPEPALFLGVSTEQSQQQQPTTTSCGLRPNYSSIW